MPSEPARPARPRALVLYGSRHGHTGSIAARLATRLEAAGIATTVVHAGERTPDPTVFDAIVLAASVHAGSHQREIGAYARRFRDELNARRSAFLSVSLTAADPAAESVRTTQALIDELLADSGWHPDATLAVAGALQYREYDIATRALMRLIARRHGASTDAGHDEEFTDWEALDAFADAFAASVPAARPAPAAAG